MGQNAIQHFLCEFPDPLEYLEGVNFRLGLGYRAQAAAIARFFRHPRLDPVMKGARNDFRFTPDSRYHNAHVGFRRIYVRSWVQSGSGRDQ